MKILEAIIIITLFSFIFAGRDIETTDTEHDSVAATVRATRTRADLDIYGSAEDYRVTDEAQEIDLSPIILGKKKKKAEISKSRDASLRLC